MDYTGRGRPEWSNHLSLALKLHRLHVWRRGSAQVVSSSRAHRAEGSSATERLCSQSQSRGLWLVGVSPVGSVGHSAPVPIRVASACLLQRMGDVDQVTEQTRVGAGLTATN